MEFVAHKGRSELRHKTRACCLLDHPSGLTASLQRQHRRRPSREQLGPAAGSTRANNVYDKIVRERLTTNSLQLNINSVDLLSVLGEIKNQDVWF